MHNNRKSEGGRAKKKKGELIEEEGDNKSSIRRDEGVTVGSLRRLHAQTCIRRRGGEADVIC